MYCPQAGGPKLKWRVLMNQETNDIIITTDNYKQRIEELDKLRQNQYDIEHEVKSVKAITDFIDALDNNVEVSNHLTNSRKDETDQLSEQIERYKRAFDEYLKGIEEYEQQEQEEKTLILKDIDESLGKVEELQNKIKELEIKCKNIEDQIEKNKTIRVDVKQFLSKDYSNTIKNTKEKTDIGSVITFGTYPQDKNGELKTPIEWIILDKKDGKALIISKYALDGKPYNEMHKGVTWESCTLREWLNATFINVAFSFEEQQRISTTTVKTSRNPKYNTNPGNNTNDKVFLLSIDQTKKCFLTSEDRTCKPTNYAITHGALRSEYNGNCWWWLRSPGGGTDYAADVDYTGTIYGGGLGVNNINAVRPAMWIDLES